MSQHSSLRGEGMGKRHRNVLKRYEKIRRLRTEEKWEDGRSVFSLPKVKSIKVKVKKAKAVEKAEEAGVAPGEGAEAPAPSPESAAKAKKKPEK